MGFWALDNTTAAGSAVLFQRSLNRTQKKIGVRSYNNLNIVTICGFILCVASYILCGLQRTFSRKPHLLSSVIWLLEPSPMWIMWYFLIEVYHIH